MVERAEAAVLCALVAACGGGAESGPGFRFDPPAGDAPFSLAAIPFPNDVLLDDTTGRIQVTAESIAMSPDADRDVVALFAEGLGARTGFSTVAGARFPTAGVTADDPIDPATLPDHVSLFEVAGGGSIPVRAVVRDDGAVYLEPATGHVLEQGRQYAYVIRTGVATTTGKPLAADPDLTRLLTSTDARAADRYSGLRALLAAMAIDPATVVGATAFTTAEYTPAMVAAREILDQQPPAAAVVDRIYFSGPELDDFFGVPDDNDFPGLDNPGGVAHSRLAAVVLGHFQAVDFTSAEPGRLGRWQLDATGAPVVKGMEDVPFFLALPQSGSMTDLPVIVFNHGFGGSRQIVAHVANSLAARGFAVIGIDIPFHGERYSGARDDEHNLTGAPGPDGLADDAAAGRQFEYLDIVGDPANGIAQLDPQVITANVRQSAVDIMSEVRLVTNGDWSALAADFPGLSFRADRVVYSGQSLGGVLGSIVTTIDPLVGASVLGVGGGGIVRHAILNSPALWESLGTILVGALGATTVEPGVPEREPQGDLGFILMQTLVDEADPLVYAGETILAPLGQPKHVALLCAFSDEVLANQSSEALAAALGLEWLDTTRSASGPRYIDPLPVRQAPLAGNVDGTTAALVLLTPAQHGMQTARHETSRFEPGFPPFLERDAPLAIDNPIVEVLDMTGEFARTYVDTGVPTLIDPF